MVIHVYICIKLKVYLNISILLPYFIYSIKYLSKNETCKLLKTTMIVSNKIYTMHGHTIQFLLFDLISIHVLVDSS
jgi:hypothetical protein